MTKWTQGPYTFEQCSRLDGATVQEWTIEAPGRDDDDESTIIAGVYTSKRDAALLAAAPDLAEALERFDRLSLVIESAVRRVESSKRDAVVEVIHAARAALAKARGEA